ncbi:MAG: response regulator transcription factor [Deltaproteobacteria bacterium]|nr:response regulator transcription factor [Deltaproteobacteria bacterium]
MTQQNILIIDDDPAQQEILGEHLLLTGFHPLHALGCDSAFDLLRTNPVALILLDINMPQVDGFQTMERLRNNKDTKEIPVLFLTSLDRQYLKIKGLELGADDYVTKPYNSAELIARIKAILRRSAPARFQPGVIQGDIHAIGLSELLQNLGQSGRASRINLPDMNGEIITAEGNILLVRQGAFSGLEALLRLLLFEKGAFTVQYDNLPEQLPEPETSIFAALLATATQVDQIKMAAETTGQQNPILMLTPQGSGIPEIDRWKTHFPLPLFTLIAMMEGGIEDNMNMALQAIIEDRIQCLPEALPASSNSK